MLISINPAAEITALQQIFTAETADSFNIGSYDYIIDAIDSLKDKTLLILMATQTQAKFYLRLYVGRLGNTGCC